MGAEKWFLYTGTTNDLVPKFNGHSKRQKRKEETNFFYLDFGFWIKNSIS